MDKIIQLHNTQQEPACSIFAHGIRSATLDIAWILKYGHSFYTWCGTEISLGKAVDRRRRCMKLFRQAFRGFVVKGKE